MLLRGGFAQTDSHWVQIDRNSRICSRPAIGHYDIQRLFMLLLWEGDLGDALYSESDVEGLFERVTIAISGEGGGWGA